MTNYIIDFDGTKILANDEIQARYIMDALISARVVEYNYKYDDPKYTIKKEWSFNIIRVEPGQVIDLNIKTSPSDSDDYVRGYKEGYNSAKYWNDGVVDPVEKQDSEA